MGGADGSGGGEGGGGGGDAAGGGGGGGGEAAERLADEALYRITTAVAVTASAGADDAFIATPTTSIMVRCASQLVMHAADRLCRAKSSAGHVAICDTIAAVLAMQRNLTPICPCVNLRSAPRRLTTRM